MIDERGRLVATGAAALNVQRPHRLWSEQDPATWWDVTSATPLDGWDRPLRPAILWNDGRSVPQCRALEAPLPELRQITGNIAMPGFTAPKLLRVREHEPEILA